MVISRILEACKETCCYLPLFLSLFLMRFSMIHLVWSHLTKTISEHLVFQGMWLWWHSKVSLVFSNFLELWIVWVHVLVCTCMEMKKKRYCSFLESLLWSWGNSYTMWVLSSFPGYRVTGSLRASSFFPACLVERWVVWKPLVGIGACRWDLLLLCFHRAVAGFSEMTSCHLPKFFHFFLLLCGLK